ncbi:MAG TPA: RsmD family RNA methyltransferase [Flavobacteriaceae bacterium]|nr:RsmD family RNA methyltransferase [Flavobacteriaceae bacterium]
MRIISGKHKGRRIIAPKTLPVRPTTDQAKESLFNILRNHFNFEEISVLDLFAGIGSLSLEFASRGVKDLTAVDNFTGCIKFVKQTAEELELNIDTIKIDVFAYLESSPRKFDVIFADPPYDYEAEDFEKIVELVFDRDLLSENGFLVLEHSKHTELPSHPNFKESRKYGAAVFSFYEKG